jgi:hypothetical protein
MIGYYLMGIIYYSYFSLLKRPKRIYINKCIYYLEKAASRKCAHAHYMIAAMIQYGYIDDLKKMLYHLTEAKAIAGCKLPNEEEMYHSIVKYGIYNNPKILFDLLNEYAVKKYM